MSDTPVQSPLNKAWNDRFYFIFNLPEALKDAGNRYNALNGKEGIRKEAVKWSLSGLTFPQEMVRSDRIPFAGGAMHFSTHTKDPYDQLTIKMKVDNRWANYLTIYEWLNFIYDEARGHYDANGLAKGMYGLRAYAANVSVVSLDEYDKPKVQWLFTHAFPVNMSSVTLDFQNPQEIEIQASFLFSQMKIRSVDGALNLGAHVS